MDSPQENKPAEQPGTASHERSTIDFPYTDLDNAIEVVRGIHNAGGTACEFDQLAAQLSMEVKGGGFRMRVNGAKTFGLVSYERGGRITLTDLGRQIIDQHQERQARLQAFLNVELYQKVYEQFKGGPLPPQAGLERSIQTMGVGAKVKDKARQVLLRSAKQAGFFDHAPDRLIKPSIRSEPQTDMPPPPRDENRSGGGNGGGGGDTDYHPFIQGLLRELPKPGEDWSVKKRYDWIATANGIFKMIYKSDEETETIKISLEKSGS